MIVYLVTNNIDGKQYVGQTIKTLQKRWCDHGMPSNTRNLYFGNAIRKMGRENFLVETLHECISCEEMDFVEMFYVSLLNSKRPNGYNLTDGGSAPHGHIVSTAGRLRMRLSHLGKVQSKEQVEKRAASLRAAHIGRPEWRPSSTKGFRKLRCKYGHDRTPDNVLVSGGGCKVCHKEKARLRRLRTQKETHNE